MFLILGWEYQPEHVQAGIYLLFYTLLASLPLLVGILFVYNYLCYLCLLLLRRGGISSGGLLYVTIILAFLVRMPMFMVHLCHCVYWGTQSIPVNGYRRAVPQR
jgi:NADH-ubiquinone oxidoreductase chain 4